MPHDGFPLFNFTAIHRSGSCAIYWTEEKDIEIEACYYTIMNEKGLHAEIVQREKIRVQALFTAK
jgi:hypothetical protein